MPLNVRLNAKTERALAALAARRQQSRSDVVREALEHYAASHESEAAGDHPFAAWADVIGIVHLGLRDPDRTTGEQFTSIVRAKARARRAR
ncbi:MAG: ribbon-helix-helix protein, CopG family [Vicinamibacterales bacterium]|nr:ribbon-helix-helix protein, CopG family [Vicinamibacterales bacterium]